jgi:hypothetical protein
MTIEQTEQINYTIFVNRIINLIYRNNNFSYDRIVFGEEGRTIGKEIYALAGYHGLFDVISLVEQELLVCELSNEYLRDLRELEFSFSGICEEFQA